jgi:UDP-glucose 4-epimerase
MILVTGGAGFIGSHMCRRLRDEGIDHVVFDNLERGWKESLGDSRLIQGDMRSREDIAAVINREEITAVIHFAAYIEVGESVKAPAAFWENNTIGVWNLLEEMRGREVNQLVFSSTAAVYGEPQQVPIPEHHPCNSTSPYGDSKLASERMIEAASDAYGLNAVRLRYFNAAGSHPDA